jgi:hypothetical protein
VRGDAGSQIPFVSASDSPTPGDFVGLRLGPGTLSATRIENMRIENAGGASGRPEGDGAIVAWGDDTASITLLGVSVVGSASDGIRLAGTSLEEGSIELEVNDCAGHPFVVDADLAGSIPVGRYVDNGIQAIGVNGGQVRGTVTWHEGALPLHVLGDLVVEGEDATSLTVTPNVEVWMEAGTAIRVGETLPGTFVASADLTERATITGPMGLATPGSWRGIVLGPQSGTTQMSHLTVAGAGGPDPEGGEAAAILARGDGPTGPTVEIHEIRIDSSAGYGLSLRNGARMDTSSEYLRVNDTADYIVHVDAQAAGDLPYDTDGENDPLLGVLVEPGTISASASWSINNGNVPYVVAGPIAVEGSPPPLLTLNEGSILRFQEGAWLEIGRNDSGDVRAAGTADQPITFTADAGATPGSWVGILLLAGMSNQTVFYQTVVEYAGAANEFSGETCGSTDAGNFVLVGAPPEFVEAPSEVVHDSVIRGSAAYGVAMDRDITADLTDPAALNTFESNALGDQTPPGC